ncbi:COG4223 family protein, partial [Teichococcus coralli]|uniref:COG4223 family protein n=1 Tax=Teichococcus coralli TaxID=2545983 RepID=UPI001367C05C
RPPAGTTPPGGGGGGRPQGPAAHGRRDHLALPVAAVSGVLALAALGVSLSSRHAEQPAVDPARVATLEQSVQALQAGPVNQLGQTIGAVQQQLQALQSGPLAQAQQRLDALQAAQQQNQAQAQQRLDALQQRADKSDQQLAALQKQLEGQASDREAFQNRVTGRIEQAERNFSQSIDSARTQLEQRIEQRIAAAEQALNPRFSAIETAMQQRIASAEEAARQRMQERDRTLDERFANLEKRESRISDAERRLNRLIATTATESALEAGRPLGQGLSTLPGEAPAALRRYADTAPPTEASLRLAFEEAAREARARSEPSTEGQSVWESAANRLGNLVTVRRGDNVVWGDPAGGQLEEARRLLDAGDLRGAVQRVEGLPDSARAPMQGWLDRAKGLLAARDALQQLRAGGQG